ncbi:MAG: hypothetical protein ABSC56_05810 [Solirubrobacteraceae bacterium]
MLIVNCSCRLESAFATNVQMAAIAASARAQAIVGTSSLVVGTREIEI